MEVIRWGPHVALARYGCPLRVCSVGNPLDDKPSGDEINYTLSAITKLFCSSWWGEDISTSISSHVHAVFSGTLIGNQYRCPWSSLCFPRGQTMESDSDHCLSKLSSVGKDLNISDVAIFSLCTFLYKLLPLSVRSQHDFDVLSIEKATDGWEGSSVLAIDHSERTA